MTATATDTGINAPVADPSASSKTRTFTVRVKRQDQPEPQGQPYWEAFEIPYRPNLNIISVLQTIAANPVTTEGKEVAPVVWESNCLEEVCGACTMLVNGHVRQSCSTLVDEYLDQDETSGATITLEPMSKFPVIRDLWVNRSRMFEDLKRIKGWVPIDGTHDLGPGPRESQDNQAFRYALSRCMTCGCCVEACPQYTKDNHFTGPQVFAQVVYFNLHETGKSLKDDRLDVMMGPGGINDCGNAQNCVKVCPKEVPITEAIAHIGRQTTVQAVKKFFTGSKKRDGGGHAD